MNRMTEHRRLKKLSLTKATVDPWVLEVAFDPKQAYNQLQKLGKLVRLLQAYGIRSTEDLENLLASRGVDNKKPPEGGTSETKAT